MDAIQSKSEPTWRSVALTGAVSGIGLVFVYALSFAVYAILRSSFSVARLTPAAVGVMPTLLANGASILVAALATAGLLAVVMAVIGALTALVIAWLLTLFNRNRLPGRALLIGGAVAFAVSFACQLALHIILAGGLGRSLLSLGATTYLFWFGLPTLLHIGAGALGAWRLHRYWSTGLLAPKARPGVALVDQAA